MKKRNGRTRLMIELEPESLEQLDALSKAYFTSMAAIIRQAVARWYLSEEQTLKRAAVRPARKRFRPAGVTRP